MNIVRHAQNLIILAVLLTAGMSGCDVLHDDLSKCNLFLQFRYDYNLAGRDLFADQVEEVKVFVFGDEGYLQTFSQSGDALKNADYRMQIPYELKGCTMVVWAGRTDRFYSLPAMSVGDSPEKLTLRYEPVEGISDSHLDALWHCGPKKMTFPDAGGTMQTVSLLRNTNDVTVSFTRSNGPVEISGYDMEIRGANGLYDYTNRLIEGCPEITYRPCSDLCADDVHYQSRLHILRIFKEGGLTLSVIDKASNEYIDMGGQTEIDLADYLLRNKPEGMAPQEYLDRGYEWNVDIRLADNPDEGYIALSITINGWTYWFHPTDL